ncbi:MAG: SpoIIE family protein phosphatase [Planctomycetota bacterium]
MKWDPSDWPIARRITGAMTLLTVAAVLTVSAFGLSRGQSAFADLSDRTLETIARKTSRLLDQLMRKARVDLQILARSEELIAAAEGGDRAAAQAEVDRYLDSDSDIVRVIVTDRTGRAVVAAPDDRPADRSYADADWFRAALEGRTFVSGLRIEDRPGVLLARPLRRPDESIVGVVLLKLDHERIRSTVIETRVGRLGYVMLDERLGSRFVVIAHPDRGMEFTTGRDLTAEERADAQRRWRRDVRVVPIKALSLHGADRQFVRARFDDTDLFGAVHPVEEVEGWTILAVLPKQEFEEPFALVATQQILTIGLVLLFAGLLAYLQSRSILRPVRALTAAAERIAAGDLGARVAIDTDDELGRLAGVFDRMVPQLEESVHLKQSLEIAGQVQRSLLPTEAPAFPGLEVAGHAAPYDQIGGDFFDYLDLRPWGDARLAVALGDVSGHGIAAAMLMATARAHLRSRAQPMPELGRLFQEVNLRLTPDLGEDQFMTLAVYVFDPQQRRVDWVTAGHDAAFHYRAETGEIEEWALKNVPIGVIPEWEYTAGTRDDLAKGDVLVLGSDGIWEARNAAKEEFGKERVRNLIRMHKDDPADALVETIHAAVERFRGDIPRQDDITLVAIRTL